jgi:hypothetical protein
VRIVKATFKIKSIGQFRTSWAARQDAVPGTPQPANYAALEFAQQLGKDPQDVEAIQTQCRSSRETSSWTIVGLTQEMSETFAMGLSKLIPKR